MILESFNIDMVVKFASLIPLFGLLGLLKILFNFDEQDEIMLSKPKQRIRSFAITCGFTVILIMGSVLLFYFLHDSNIIGFNEKIIIALFVSAYLFLPISAFFMNDLSLANFDKNESEFKTQFFIFTMLNILEYPLISITTFKLFMLIICIINLIISIKIVKKYKLNITKIITSDYYLMLTLIIYFIGTMACSKIPTTNFKTNLIVQLSLLFYILLNIILFKKINKKIFYFYCTKKLASEYKIAYNNSEKIKLYIYSTTNDKYFVCGKEKEMKNSSERYLIEYDVAIKCGGFKSEKLRAFNKQS